MEIRSDVRWYIKWCDGCVKREGGRQVVVIKLGGFIHGRFVCMMGASGKGKLVLLFWKVAIGLGCNYSI